MAPTSKLMISSRVNLKNCPFCHFNPPSTKGGGYFILAIWQKSLLSVQFACMQIFRALASKLRISSRVNFKLYHILPI